MSIDTDTSLETWEVTLPQEEAGCDFCDGPAEWRSWVVPCGCGSTMCAGCKAKVDRQNAHVSGIKPCSECKQLASGLKWWRI